MEINSNTPSRWLGRPVALKGIELEWRAREGSPREAKVGGLDGHTARNTVIVYLQGALLTQRLSDTPC